MRNSLQLPVYVLDAHTLYWYWNEPTRLGPNAERAFHELEGGTAIGFAPTIVLLEIDSLMRRRHQPQALASLINLIDQSPALRLDPLTRDHLLQASRLPDLVDIHDRIIAAAALVHSATLITRDLVLRRHPLLQTAW